jgi:hypothetical protein
MAKPELPAQAYLRAVESERKGVETLSDGQGETYGEEMSEL